MLRVIGKRSVYIIKTIVSSVAHQFSYRHTAIHAAGHLPRRLHAAADQTMQQAGTTSGQQRRVYGLQ